MIPANTLMPRSAPGKPLVAVKNLEEMAASDKGDQPQDPDQSAGAPGSFLSHESQLAGHIRRAWDTAKMYKEKVALRMLAALRARRGVYSQAQLQQLQQTGGLNFVWVDLTETKCRAASAWIREVLMPAGDRPWMLNPSPMPDLPEEMKKGIVKNAAMKAQEAMVQAQQAGGGVMGPMEFRLLAVEIGEKMRDEVQATYKRMASRAADRMSEKIADDMDEGGWERAMDEFIEDFVTYPAAVMEGPVYKRSKQLKWLPGFKLGVDEEPRQHWSRISPFDAYPSPYATSPQQGEFIVRKRYQRRELFDCIGVPGYDGEQIRKVLRDYSDGHLESWLWTEAERNRLEQETMYTFLSPKGVIDAVHYWGSVPGWVLMSWNWQPADIEKMDPEQEYEVEAILVGQYVIRCAINKAPLGWRPYYSACYDAVPGAFWGNSVPDLADTSQKMVNAAACALADNMGMASGPQIWVHRDRLADGENSVEIFPWKVWQLKSADNQGVNPGVGFFQPNDNSQNLMKVIETWEMKADDSTGIPRYTYGNERVGGAADTYSGLSMLMNNAAKGLRRAIGNVDVRVIQPTVYYAYVHEMIYGKDPTLKGDCVAVPRGASAILVKEAQTQARLQALTITANEFDMPIIGMEGRAELLRQALKALDIPTDDVVPNSDAIQRRMEEQQQMAQQQLAVEQQAAQGAEQARLEAAQLSADSQERQTGAKLAAQIRMKQMDREDNANDPSKQPPGKKTKESRKYDDKGNLVGESREREE